MMRNKLEVALKKAVSTSLQLAEAGRNETFEVVWWGYIKNCTYKSEHRKMVLNFVPQKYIAIDTVLFITIATFHKWMI